MLTRFLLQSPIEFEKVENFQRVCAAFAVCAGLINDGRPTIFRQGQRPDLGCGHRPGMGFGISLHGSNLEPLMSALGQKRTSEDIQSMSALPQKRTFAS